MSEKYKFHDPEGIYFVTITLIHWIDLFTRKEFKHVLVDALNHCVDKKGLVVYAWVIMPSHIHLIIRSRSGDPSDVIRDFKKHTSREILKVLGRINESRKEWLLRAFAKEGERLKRITRNKVWQDGNHPISLDTNKMMNERLDYLHNNPVEDDIVFEPVHYLYNSAGDYAGIKGMVKVELIS